MKKFLRHKLTGMVFPWTELREKKPYMEPFDPDAKEPTLLEILDAKLKEAIAAEPVVDLSKEEVSVENILEVNPAWDAFQDKSCEKMDEIAARVDESLPDKKPTEMSMTELRAYAKVKYALTFPVGVKKEEILTEVVARDNEETIHLTGAK